MSSLGVWEFKKKPDWPFQTWAGLGETTTSLTARFLQQHRTVWFEHAILAGTPPSSFIRPIQLHDAQPNDEQQVEQRPR